MRMGSIKLRNVRFGRRVNIRIYVYSVRKLFLYLVMIVLADKPGYSEVPNVNLSPRRLRAKYTHRTNLRFMRRGISRLHRAKCGCLQTDLARAA